MAGQACHRAVADIAVGEVLTTCYLGARAAFDRRTRRGETLSLPCVSAAFVSTKTLPFRADFQRI